MSCQLHSGVIAIGNNLNQIPYFIQLFTKENMLEGILISYKHGNLLNEKIFCI
jgi:hypothetical protein